MGSNKWPALLTLYTVSSGLLLHSNGLALNTGLPDGNTETTTAKNTQSSIKGRGFVFFMGASSDDRDSRPGASNTVLGPSSKKRENGAVGILSSLIGIKHQLDSLRNNKHTPPPVSGADQSYHHASLHVSGADQSYHHPSLHVSGADQHEENGTVPEEASFSQENTAILQQNGDEGGKNTARYPSGSGGSSSMSINSNHFNNGLFGQLSQQIGEDEEPAIQPENGSNPLVVDNRPSGAGGGVGVLASTSNRGKERNNKGNGKTSIHKAVSSSMLTISGDRDTKKSGSSHILSVAHLYGDTSGNILNPINAAVITTTTPSTLTTSPTPRTSSSPPVTTAPTTSANYLATSTAPPVTITAATPIIPSHSATRKTSSSALKKQKSTVRPNPPGAGAKTGHKSPSSSGSVDGLGLLEAIIGSGSMAKGHPVAVEGGGAASRGNSTNGTMSSGGGGAGAGNQPQEGQSMFSAVVAIVQNVKVPKKADDWRSASVKVS